jgi:CrcB protein
LTAVLLGLGGACGSVARYRVGASFSRRETNAFPLGTFLINISGSFLLGILCGLRIQGNWYVLFGDGFCGAFTTFSTFSLESVRLLQGRARRKFAAFVGLSLLAGLGCFFAGYILGKIL